MRGAGILDSRQSWLRLAVSLLIATVGNVGLWSIIVVMPGVEAEFATSRGTSALPYVLTMAGFALGNLLIGRVVDRYGITSALIGAGLLNGTGFALAALAPSIPVLAAMQFLIGFGTAASFGPLIADVSLWFRRRRGIAVAIAASGNYISGAVWPLALGWMLGDSGWRAAYLALAAISVAAMLPLSLFLRRRLPVTVTAGVDAEADARLRATAFGPRRLALLLGLAGVGCCVAMSMPQVHIVSYCTDLGYGPAVGAEMLSVMLGAGIISRLAFGLLADRLGGVRTLLISSAGQLLALTLYLPWDGMAALYAISLIFGLSQGGIVPSYALIVREYMPSREAGSRIGFVLMATIAGMALGGWLSGAIFDLTGSYRMAFLNGIAWNLLNIAIIGMILLRSRGAGGQQRPLAQP
ncbi:MAG: MFS transporter [Paracoccaceae bacterium]|nr:MAG: MFS transporter [Paracoccaceae bacterium]